MGQGVMSETSTLLIYHRREILDPISSSLLYNLSLHTFRLIFVFSAQVDENYYGVRTTEHTHIRNHKLVLTLSG
jgi:hypothetical protein